MNRYGPVFTLAFLAPFIAEFLFGATPLSRIAGFIFLALLYGGGALLIRELVRRRGRAGWIRIAVLGAAYAFVQEGLVIQSFFNPTLFRAGEIGGRALGVNFVWCEWTVGYHILWSLLIPIALTEVLFPEDGERPWLKTGGVVGAAVCYVIGAAVIAVAFRQTVAPDFRAPHLHLLVTAVLAAILALAALAWPATPESSESTATADLAPSPWLLGVTILLTSAGWFGLLFLPETLKHGTHTLVPILAAAGVAIAVGWIVKRWSARRNWTDQHRLAVVLGALPVTMCFGFFIVTAGNWMDQAGQAVGCLITLVFLALLARRLRRRSRPILTQSSAA
jgi:hypothetical protein